MADDHAPAAGAEIDRGAGALLPHCSPNTIPEPLKAIAGRSAALRAR